MTIRNIEEIRYIDISPLMINNAIRIYQHWKQLDTEVRTISTRGVNFPGELSEIFACYALGYKLNKATGGDAYDSSTDRIIEMKGSGSEKDDLSSFSPSEDFDELVFIKVKKEEDIIDIYCTGINSEQLKQIPVNRTETVGDHQREGRRPRFSIEDKIIRPNGIAPTCKFNLLTRQVINL